MTVFGKLTPAQARILATIRDRANDASATAIRWAYRSQREFRSLRAIERAGFIRISDIRAGLKVCKVELL